MAHRTIGRLMPSRVPNTDANDDYVYKQKDFVDHYNIYTELTPKTLANILAQADSVGDLGPLFNIYEKMLVTDTRYAGLIGQLESAISGMPLKIIPAHGATPEEQRIADDYAEMMEEVLANLDVHGLTKSFIDPFHLGVRLYQLKWDMFEYPYGRKIWMPIGTRAVEGRHLRMDVNFESERKGELMLTTRKHPEGEYISGFDESSYLLLYDREVIGRQHTVGVARKVLPWYLGIQFVQSWWVRYIEGYGAPMRIGKYPSGASNSAKNNMEKFLRILGQNGYALFPAEMEIQLIEANRQGTISTYSDFIKKGHDEYTIAILGQNDTVADSRNGSFARTQETNGIRFEIIENVAEIVAKGYRQLSQKTLQLNYGSEFIKRLMPTIKPLVITPQGMEVKTASALQLQEKGVAVPEEYFYDQILGSSPRKGQNAVKFGQVYVFGVDPEPENPLDKKMAFDRETNDSKNEIEREKIKSGNGTNDNGPSAKTKSST